jgi:hypothetical protein
MKNTLRTGLALALSASTLATGCGGGEDNEKVKPVPLEVVVDHDVQLYDRAYDMEEGTGAKAGVLKVGSKVVATCLAETDPSQFSSVRVESASGDSSQTGYSGVYSLQGSKDETPTPIFDRSLEQLQQLPNCD